MTSYAIRHIPQATFPSHFGVNAPMTQVQEHYCLTLRCSRGLAWDGGEYATRDEAIAAGRAKTAKGA